MSAGTDTEATKPRRACATPQNRSGCCFMERYSLRPSQRVITARGIEIHFMRQAAVSAAAIHDQNPSGSKPRWNIAITVWTTKRRAVREPATTKTNDLPYEGSTIDGFGRATPTARAPQAAQPSVKAPLNLKPQQGQIVTYFSPLKQGRREYAKL